MRAFAAAALLVVAAPTSAQDVSVRFLTVKSAALGEERTILVHLPPGHDPARPYPVLYFTDGQAHLPLLATMVRFLAAHGRSPELILVGLTHPDRARDLTPTRGHLPGPGGREIRFETSGGADRFLAFVADEVVPLVERRYKTAPFRILAGHSFGGLFALHALQARPGLFQAVVAASPSLAWDDDLAVRRTRELLERTREPPARALVVTVGDEGRVQAERFDALRAVLAKGAGRMRWKALHLAGEDHGTAVFEGFYEGLKEIFDGYLMPEREDAVGPDGGVAAVSEHYRALSRALGFEIAPPEATLVDAGRQCAFVNDHDGALRAFQRAAEAYPASPGAQRVLAEAYERTGELDRAADAYRRALELAKARGDGQEAFYTARLQRIEAARAGRRHPDADKIGLPENSVYRCGGHDFEAPGVTDYRR